jgi:RNA polymerase sigma-70 factor (ECF subfamily)
MDARALPSRESAAFEAVMQEHTPRVFRSLRYLGVPESDLPDACQEVFLVVHRRLEEFRGDASLATWIYAICFRVARALKRRAASRRDAPMSEPPVVPMDAQQESQLQVERARKRLLELLDMLPEEQRVVVVLHELEELKMSEVADTIGCPLFTAYSRLRLGRKRLEQLLLQSDCEAIHG